MNDILTSDHRELDVLLDHLYHALDQGTATDVFETLDIFWARLAMHIRAEHLHLFPAIQQAAESQTLIDVLSLKSVNETLEQLRHDHDFFVRELAAAVKIARELVVRDQDAAEKFSLIREKVVEVHKLLETHNEIEETQVYLWGEYFVERPNKTELNELVKKELDKLPPRFEGDRTGSQKRIYN